LINIHPGGFQLQFFSGIFLFVPLLHNNHNLLKSLYMKRILLVAVVAALLGCNKDDDDNSNNLNSTDTDFTMKATMGNTAEISAGQMASLKATAANVKAFGQMMVSDHGTAKTELHNIASDLNLYSPDSLDAQHVALAAQLSTLTGRAFDSVYIHSQVNDHLQTISLFQNEINSGMNSRLKNYANDQMPHLQLHLQNAQAIAAAY